MPRGRKTTNTANPENETKKKTKRRKKTVETPVEAAPAVENAATDAVVNVPVEVAEAPAPKKRGRKPKDAADAVTTEAPVKKTRGRKPKAAAETVADTPADTTTDAPVKKTRGRKAKAETPADAPVNQSPRYTSRLASRSTSKLKIWGSSEFSSGYFYNRFDKNYV